MASLVYHSIHFPPQPPISGTEFRGLLGQQESALLLPVSMREARTVNSEGTTGLFSWVGNGQTGQGQGGQEGGEAGQLQEQFTNLTFSGYGTDG